MKTDIYSPIDGEIKYINELDDQVFSKEMLGSGFFIKPETNIVSSPLNNSILFDIFDTKHAFIVKQNEIAILVHIGLDTVNLKGEPFKFLVEKNKNLSIKEKIVEVDFNQIREKYNDAVCVTFLNQNEFKNVSFKLLKNGKIKAGEKVAEITLDNINSDQDNILDYKNRYQVIAENLYNAIGTETNYSNFYNCITRLRFYIKEKSKVDENKLKKIKNIQGYVWQGNELQIIIGADVIKAKDAYEQFLLEKDKKYEKKEKDTVFVIFKKNISGVMTMLIPYLVASGMLYAIFSVLSQLGAVENVYLEYNDPSNITFLNDYNVLTGVFYIICTSGITFMGFAFGYCTIKFLGGNTVIGSLICLSLLAIPLFSGMSWELFKIGEVSFNIQGYTNLIIPQIFAAIFYVYIDRWIKTWMPSVVDLILRHVLAVFITLTLTFFVMGPFLGLLELVFYYLLTVIDTIPLGISVAIFSILAPCLTVLGIAWAVSAPITAQVAGGTPNAMNCAWYLGEFSMAGAAFAVALKTKNKRTKELSINGGITGLFGVSEPALYTVLLPRFWPFLFAIISAGVSGLIVGILGLKTYSLGGGGIFFFTQFMSGGTSAILISILGLVISFSLSFSLTFFFWKEKMNQVKQMEKTNNLVLLVALKYAQQMGIEINIKKHKAELLKLKNNFNKDYFDQSNDVEKTLNERLKTEVNLIAIRDKIEKRKVKFINKIKKYNSSKNLKKIENLKSSFNTNIYESKENELNIKLFKLNEIAKENVDKFNILNLKILNEAKNNLNILAEELNYIKIKDFINTYFNIIYNIEIFYNYEEVKPLLIGRRTLRQISKGEMKNEK